MGTQPPPQTTAPGLAVTTPVGHGPRVVLVHGFTQTATSWRPIVERTVAELEVVCVDAHGHGGSATVRADLRATADLLAPVVAGAVLVGYSMGARMALRLALDHPRMVSGLVLVGATAGIDDPAERARRRAADDALAARIEADAAATGSLRTFVERWVAQPLFGPRPLAEDDLASRLAQSPAGLASSLRLAGTGTMDPPLWDRLAEISVPTTVLWGERDQKFAALGRRLATGIAASGTPVRALPVPDAYHAAHLDRPELVAAEIIRTARRAGEDGGRDRA